MYRAVERIDHKRLIQRQRNRLAATMGLGALALFWLTLCSSAFPGESSLLLSTQLGIEPHLAPNHPIWRTFTAIYRYLPFKAAVYALNLSSALCGALAVALLCRYVVAWIDIRIDRRDASIKQPAKQSAMLAGIVAAFALATSIPFWTASTRAGVFSFYAVFLLLEFNLLLDYRIQGGIWRLYALAAICGAGCAESFLFILMTPYFVLATLAALYEHEGTFNLKQHPWGMALAIFTGICIYVLAIWFVTSSHGKTPYGFTETLTLSGSMFTIQLRQNLSMFARTGWLWMLLMTFMPWLLIQFDARRGLNQRHKTFALPLYSVLLVVVLLVQANAPFLLWSDTLPAGRLPLLEHILTAMVIGFLAAFWFLRLRDPDLRAGDVTSIDGKKDNTRAENRFIRSFAGVVAGILLLFILLASFQNFKRANGKRTAFCDAYVNAILDQMHNRAWLVTDGLLDLQLKVAARRRNQQLNLINLAAERSPHQISRLRHTIANSSLWADKTASLRNAASLGAAAFLREWLATETNSYQDLAFYAPPDLLIEAGLTQRPDQLLFVGVSDLETLQNRPLLEEHHHFWNLMDKLLSGKTKGDPVNMLRGTLRRHLSMAANNLGVLLEDLERPEDAYVAYCQALTFTPDNFSAMLNRVVLTRKGIMPTDRKKAEADAAKALKTLKRRPEAGRLARFYGYVRVPAEFARQSAEWMRFGRPRMASVTLSRAVELTPDHQSQKYLGGLADIHLAEGQPEKSKTLLQRILKKDPRDPQALRGMVRLSLMQQDIAAAREWLKHMQATDMSSTALALETATIDIAAGDFEKAQRHLQQLTDANSRNLHAWALQANLLLSQDQATEVESIILPRMETAAGNAPHYLVALTRGFTHLAKGPESFPVAREAFQSALALNPGNRSILAELLKLNYALRDEAATEHYAAELLRLDPDDALANYLMGTLQIKRHDLSSAEAYLRRSLAQKESAPVWNDLAETLRLRGHLYQAEQAARQSLSINAKSPYAYDTLACILLDAGHLPEALQACKAALSLAPEAIPFTLTEVRILARTGDIITARQKLQKIRLHHDKLAPQQQAALNDVEAEITKDR